MNISYLDDVVYEYFTSKDGETTFSVNDPIECFWESLVEKEKPASLFGARSFSKVERSRVRELVQNGVPFTVDFILGDTSVIERQHITTKTEMVEHQYNYKFTTRLLFNVTITNPKHAIYYKLKWSE